MRLSSIGAMILNGNKTGPLDDKSNADENLGTKETALRSETGCRQPECVVRCPFHRALMCSMSVFGLFYPQNFSEFGTLFRKGTMIYSVCIALFIVLNTLRVFVTIFDSTDDIGVTFNKINYAAWLLLCAFNVCMFVWMSSVKKHGMRSYYCKMKRTIERMDEVGIPLKWKKTWKIEVPCIAVGWLLVIANSVLVGRRLFDERKGEESEWLCRLTTPGNGNQSWLPLGEDQGRGSMMYVMTVAVSLASGAWIWPVVYIINIAAHTTLAFKCLNKRMCQLVASDHVAFLRDIGLYRQLHWEIRKCVDIADRYLRFVIGVHIVLYLLLSMMEIYNLAQFKALRDSSNVELLAAYIIWLISALVMLAAECAASSFISDASLETSKPLFKLADRCGDLDNHQLFQVQLFLGQLKDPSGFNVMGLFVLTKEGLLAIVGTWVTYFLIVLQFAPPDKAQ